MEIYDCFTYYNEDAVLRIRFEELYDTVDRFVVVEANQTFTGHPKPLFFDQLGWTKEFEDKIDRIVVDFPAEDMSPWDREVYQRNAIMSGLTGCGGNDSICISDADEIPRPDRLRAYPQPVQLDVTQYFWSFNWQVPAHCNQGARPVLAMFKHLLSRTPQELRAAALPRIPYGGWHFSFFCDPEATRTKIEAFSHQEVNLEKYKNQEQIRKRMRRGIDPFGRFPLKYSRVDETYPKTVQRGRI